MNGKVTKATYPGQMLVAKVGVISRKHLDHPRAFSAENDIRQGRPVRGQNHLGGMKHGGLFRNRKFFGINALETESLHFPANRILVKQPATVFPTHKKYFFRPSLVAAPKQTLPEKSRDFWGANPHVARIGGHPEFFAGEGGIILKGNTSLRRDAHVSKGVLLESSAESVDEQKQFRLFPEKALEHGESGKALQHPVVIGVPPGDREKGRRFFQVMDSAELRRPKNRVVLDFFLPCQAGSFQKVSILRANRHVRAKYFRSFQTGDPGWLGL
jgi:hypothetical protein